MWSVIIQLHKFLSCITQLYPLLTCLLYDIIKWHNVLFYSTSRLSCYLHTHAHIQTHTHTQRTPHKKSCMVRWQNYEVCVTVCVSGEAGISISGEDYPVEGLPASVPACVVALLSLCICLSVCLSLSLRHSVNLVLQSVCVCVLTLALHFCAAFPHFPPCSCLPSCVSFLFQSPLLY